MYEISVIRQTGKVKVYSKNVSLNDAKVFDFGILEKLLQADCEYVENEQKLAETLRKAKREING